MEIKNKKITILGAVRSGVGAAKLAKKLGAVTAELDPGEISAAMTRMAQQGETPP